MMKDPSLEVELEDSYYRRPQEFKVVLLGDSSVGKTSLMMRFVRNDVNKKSVKLCIWDTAGQERFRCLAPMYYRGATAAILVYDITSAHSFEVLQTVVLMFFLWLADNTSSIVLAIAGNKVDVEDSRAVSTKAADEYAASVGAIFFETSAKLDIQ
eukprot:gene25687-31021_t